MKVVQSDKNGRYIEENEPSEAIFFSDEPFSEMRIRKEIKSQPHIRETTEVKLVLSGEADFLIENRAVSVCAGEILIIENFVVHSLVERVPSLICTLSLPTEGKNPRRIKKPFMGGFMKISVKDIPSFSEIFGLLPKLLTAAEENGSYASFKAAAYILLGILEKAEIIEGELQENSDEPSVDRLETVKEYVRLHLSEEITVAAAARLLGLNPSYFCRIFKKETGSTFISFVNAYRIEQARKRLLQTNAGITDIMYGCGFSNYGYFNKVFRQYTGCSPTEYRRKK